MLRIFRRKGQSIFRRKRRNIVALFLHGWGKKKQPSATITSYPPRKLGKHEDEFELFSKSNEDWEKELRD